MSGGGSSGGNNGSGGKSPASTARVAYPNAPTQATTPQAMPGQLEAIASQLAMGYGGTQKSNMAHLDNLYSPVQTILFKEPPSVTAERYMAGNYKPISSGNVTLDEILMGGKPGSTMSGGTAKPGSVAKPGSSVGSKPMPASAAAAVVSALSPGLPGSGMPRRGRDQFNGYEQLAPAGRTVKRS